MHSDTSNCTGLKGSKKQYRRPDRNCMMTKNFDSILTQKSESQALSRRLDKKNILGNHSSITMEEARGWRDNQIILCVASRIEFLGDHQSLPCQLWNCVVGIKSEKKLRLQLKFKSSITFLRGLLIWKAEIWLESNVVTVICFYLTSYLYSYCVPCWYRKSANMMYFASRLLSIE